MKFIKEYFRHRKQLKEYNENELEHKLLYDIGVYETDEEYMEALSKLRCENIELIRFEVKCIAVKVVIGIIIFGIVYMM
ncbi:MAG: hypothetical protein ACRC5M_05190 [Anaeroplasmataceae bacterium]